MQHMKGEMLELNRVEIDVDKLILIIQAKGMTMEKFGYSIGRSRNYICSLRKNNMVPEPVRDLICEKLEIDPERIEKTQITSGEEVKILENIFKEIQSIKTQISELADAQQAIYNKLQANTVQTARIKDVVDELGQTEYDRAELFLRETLKGGQVSAVELMQRADDGIKRSELMKAKAKMDVKIYATGYGKNQKSWWSLK